MPTSDKLFNTYLSNKPNPSSLYFTPTGPNAILTKMHVKSDQYRCSKYGFCIIIPEGIIDLRLIIMLLVRMS